MKPGTSPNRDPDLEEAPVSPEPSAAQPIDRPPPRGGRWGGALRRGLGGVWLAAIASTIVAPLIVAIGLTAVAEAPTAPSAARVVSSDTLASEFGIRFDLVGVTAAGGLVEIRFTVLDASKARNLFHDPSSVPTLFVEQSGAVLHTKKGMSHRLELLDGARYFLLFPNAGGVVQSGTPVSIVIDDVKIEPIAAQT